MLKALSLSTGLYWEDNALWAGEDNALWVGMEKGVRREDGEGVREMEGEGRRGEKLQTAPRNMKRAPDLQVRQERMWWMWRMKERKKERKKKEWQKEW